MQSISSDSSRALYRMGSVGFIAGLAIIIVSTYFHASSHDISDNVLTFPVYAASETWIAAHIGQFAGVMLVFAGGFAALSRYLAQSLSGTAVALAWLGLAVTIITASTFAILQAVDGIALKRAVDSWVAAPEGSEEKSIYFGVAEGIRWTEIGINSMFRILQGAVSIIFGVSIALSRLLSKWIGGFGVFAGAATIIAGIGVAYFGFVELPVIGIVATVTSFVWPVILGAFFWIKTNGKSVTR